MSTLTLTEHARFLRGPTRDLHSTPPTLDEATFEALRRYDERLAVRRTEQIFDWRATSAKARHWVGVMQCGDLCVEILPKAGEQATSQRHNLLVMLEVAGHAPQRKREQASQSLSNANLLEVFITRFATELLDLLGRGPQQGYVGREENCKVLKGKLLFSEHIKHNCARQDRFFVRHDEMSSDHLLNQILATTCESLLALVRGSALRKTLMRCLDYLEGVRPLALRTDHFDRLILTRQTAHWAPAISFCRLVHQGMAPDMRAGQRKDITLLFDMNALFEGFVTALFGHLLNAQPEAGYQCVVQGKGQRKYLLHERLDATSTRSHLHLKPDIMLVHPHKPPLLIDTKWKRLRKEGSTRQHVAREDLYQMFGYAHRFGSRRNILLYPSPDDTPTRWRQDFQIPHLTQNNSCQIEVHTLDLTGNLRHLSKLFSQLSQLLEDPEHHSNHAFSQGAR